MIRNIFHGWLVFISKWAWSLLEGCSHKIAGVSFNGNMIFALSFHRRVGGNLYTPLKNDGVRQLGYVIIPTEWNVKKSMVPKPPTITNHHHHHQ